VYKFVPSTYKSDKLSVNGSVDNQNEDISDGTQKLKVTQRF